MNGLMRLLLAVVALLLFCPLAHSEPVSLFQETGWGRDDASSLPHQYARYTFRTQGADILIGSENFPVSEARKTDEPTEWFTAVSLEETLWKLVRPVPEASPAVAVVQSDKPAQQRDLGDKVPSTVSGFYNDVVFQAWREAQLLIPLDAYFSLLGGALFYDSSTDPLSRFSVQPGSTNMTQTTFLFAETQRAGGEIVRYWENLSFSPLQAVLLVLLGFALALLPAIFRRLKFLVRFMPSMPGKVKETIGLLRKDYEVQPNQIETIQFESENDMKRRQRMVVKRDESWRKSPPVPAVEIETVNGGTQQTVRPAGTGANISHLPQSEDFHQPQQIDQPATSASHSVRVALPPEPVEVAAPVSYTGPTRSQRRQPSGKHGANTRIYRLSPPTGMVSQSEVERPVDRNGSAEFHHEPANGFAEKMVEKPVEKAVEKFIEPPPVVPEPAVMRTPPVIEAAPQRKEMPRSVSEPARSRSYETSSTMRRWFDSLPETTNSPLVEDIEVDPLLNHQNRQTTMTVEEPPVNSFRELRTGAILQWLEGRVPALTEAVAWEEEHLAEYRGLPFASVTLEEGEGEPSTAQEAPGF